MDSRRLCCLLLTILAVHLACVLSYSRAMDDADVHANHVEFTMHSIHDGDWTDPNTWQPAQVPAAGDRVLISRGTHVRYDTSSDDVIRLVQVIGTLQFARDRNTLLNVGVLKVQNSDECSESGFACDFRGTSKSGEPQGMPEGPLPTLEVGSGNEPIPSEFTARIRLHYLQGMDERDAPALVCCAARLELHGAPMHRTWLKLNREAAVGDTSVQLAEDPQGWHVGDEVIVTGSQQQYKGDTFRNHSDVISTEERRITAIDGNTIQLDKALQFAHAGSGDFRCEVANLSRNVIVESADPNGVRGHTLFHRFSRGGISYARFAHLGKENVLGRYAIHFHLIGDTMRGSSVIGAAIVDSYNRWITIHGADYLVVRDCIGYQSVGHGFFMEDGTETYNLFDRNLGVQAYRGRPLPDQVLPFDPNDGAAYWWANGRNSLVRNVACENDEYGYRFDSENRSDFDSHLPVRMPDGHKQIVDIRTLPISRFSENESHTEGLYSMAFAGTDGVGPDVRHPHHLSHLKMWETHYALRTELPTMLVEHAQMHYVVYGVYRPWFQNHVYRDLTITRALAEPFNRGMDDDSMQHGIITVDGLTFNELGYGGQMPLIQMSDNNFSGDAESHFRNVHVLDRETNDRWPLVNLGGGPRPQRHTATGVPVYIHDYYGPGRHAKIVSTRETEVIQSGDYHSEPPLTGDESAVMEVHDVDFPQLLDPVDDQPPATVILSIEQVGGTWMVRGVAHDNGEIKAISVNGHPAEISRQCEGLVDWQIQCDAVDNAFEAFATDDSGNVEKTPHRMKAN